MSGVTTGGLGRRPEQTTGGLGRRPDQATGGLGRRPEQTTGGLGRRPEQTTVEDQVREALELLRPAIQMDGGDIELIGIHDGKVTVRLLGTCEACPISPVTLKHGVERVLSERVPGITEVVAIEA